MYNFDQYCREGVQIQQLITPSKNDIHSPPQKGTKLAKQFWERTRGYAGK